MLKFIKHHMETISGIEIYPLVSFLIFFIFFLLMLIYIFKTDKESLQELSALPLDKDNDKEPVKGYTE